MSPRTVRRSPSLRLTALGGAAGALVAGLLTATVASNSAVAAPASPLPLSHYAVVDSIDMPAGALDANRVTVKDDSIWVSTIRNHVYQLNPFTNEWVNSSGVSSPLAPNFYYGLAASDDTVYTSSGDDTVAIWAFPRGQASGAIDDTLSIETVPGVAPGTEFGTITTDAAGYVYAQTYDTTDAVVKLNPQITVVEDSVAVPNPDVAYSMVARDDTLYVPVYDDSQVAVIRTSDMSLVRNIPAAYSVIGVAVTSDHLVYSGSDQGTPNEIVITDATTGAVVSRALTPEAAGRFGCVCAMAASSDDTVFGVYEYVSVINPGSQSVDDSVKIPNGDYLGGYYSVGVWDGSDGRGVVYVPLDSGGIITVAPISAAVSATSGTVTLTVSGPPDVIVDDSTVVGVDISGSAVPVTPLGGGQFSFDIGSATASDVAVRLYGGNVIGVSGGVTPTPTPPAPASPPSAPLDVSAVPGDRSATVSWREPASPGSFPVSMYRAAASPGGGACLVAAPALTCTVSGLANGTPYTFRVEALNGAGWSPASGPSAPVTPGGVTPAPSPVPLPSPLDPGSSLLQVNGVVDPNVSVDPNPQDNGLTITGEGWSMDLDGLGPDGNPLNLGPDGVLRLATERDVATQGTGFLPNSEVDLYVDPPVLVQGAIGVRASGQGTYVGTVRTDASGSFSGTATLPDGIEPGDHVVQAVGYSPTRQSRAMSLGVEVEPWIVLDKGTRKPAGVHDRMSTQGTTGGIEAGAKLTPHIRFGSGAWKTGVATITVNSDGNFTWSRLVRKDKRLTAYVSYLDTESNRVVWARVR